MTYYNQWPDYGGPIINRIPSRKLVRRGSFALKDLDVCMFGAEARPMNLSYIKTEIQKLLDGGFTFNIDEGLNANDPKVTIPQVLKYFFIIKDGTVEYRPEMSIERFGEAIESINNLNSKYYFKVFKGLDKTLNNLIISLKLLLGNYIHGTRLNFGIRNNSFKTHLLTAATSHTKKGGRRLRNITRRKRRKN